MRIILDFDFTIFNTKKLREAIRDVFLKYGVDEELFSRTLEESRGEGGDWEPARQFETLKSLGVTKIEHMQRDFDKVIKDSYLFLYEDTVPFLKKIKNEHSLALLTYGGNSFQSAKLAGCSLATKYFDKILITQNLHKDKEASELSLGKPALFAEDNPLALYAAKKYAPHIITVRINRGDGRYSQEQSLGGIDYEVKDLEGVENIVQNCSNYSNCSNCSKQAPNPNA